MTTQIGGPPDAGESATSPKTSSEALFTIEEGEWVRYAAHGPVLEQATSFLAHIAATISLFVTVTGAAWVVVSSNTLGVSGTTLLWILALHIAMSLGCATALWGIGNNFIQRLNFARWLGVHGWPSIERLGGPEFAWKGVPAANAQAAEGIGRNARGSESSWKEQSSLMRYRAFTWPSIRLQRLWFLLPLGAAGFSIVLFAQVREDGKTRNALCNQAAATLSFPDSASISRETFERARYLFDKAGCEITLFDLRRLRGGV